MPKSNFRPPSGTTVSFSRLDLYSACSQKFFYKYVEAGASRPEPLKDYMIKGTLAHYMLEEILTGTSWLDALTLALPSWIEEACGLPIAPDVEAMRQGVAIHPESLGRYAELVSNILLQCAGNYAGDDAIRNADGSVPQDPLGYPPKSVKRIMNDLGLNEERQTIDLTATRLNHEFTPYSLANITAEAVFCARNYSPPDYFSQTLAIEYPIYPQSSEDSPVLFVEGKYWSGYIDWIFETDQGELVIADHKTGKKRPTGSDVLWHQQLNLYVGLYYERTGKVADFIAINHLPTNTIVRAKVDPIAVGEAMKLFKEVQTALDAQVFLKRFPTGFNSPCIDRNYKTQVIQSVCPYLERCWPYYLQDIEGELMK